MMAFPTLALSRIRLEGPRRRPRSQPGYPSSPSAAIRLLTKTSIPLPGMERKRGDHLWVRRWRAASKSITAAAAAAFSDSVLPYMGIEIDPPEAYERASLLKPCASLDTIKALGWVQSTAS